MKKPVIGLTPSHEQEKNLLYLYPTYIHALRESGAACFVFPLGSAGEELAQLTAMCDGVLFTGGPDVHPFYFGEDAIPECGEIASLRDKTELELLPLAMEQQIPILGVCRGIQLINIALGGDIYQDLDRQFTPTGPSVAHRQLFDPKLPAHHVTVAEGSRLAAVTGQSRLEVNTLHHQAIRKLAPSLTACASSPDGLVEAVEMEGYPFLMAVQWHPEYLFDSQESAKRLFQAFVEACSASKTASK